MRVTLLAVLAACGSAAPPPPPLHHEAPGPAPPELFAALFQPRQTWTFATAIVHGGDGPHATTHGSMTCRVVSTAHPIPTVWMSTITCDGADDELGSTSQPAGVYVANEQGLWRFAEPPEDPLDDSTMLIAARPSPQLHEDMVPDQRPRGSVAIVAHGGGWCVSQTTIGGDESGSVLCFRGDVGFLGGSAFFAGGRSIDTSWGDVPK